MEGEQHCKCVCLPLWCSVTAYLCEWTRTPRPCCNGANSPVLSAFTQKSSDTIKPPDPHMNIERAWYLCPVTEILRTYMAHTQFSIIRLSCSHQRQNCKVFNVTAAKAGNSSTMNNISHLNWFTFLWLKSVFLPYLKGFIKAAVSCLPGVYFVSNLNIPSFLNIYKYVLQLTTVCV